jgi:predicted chitinase
MNIYFGIVENRSDPLLLGRCQVRVVGLHTHDKNLLPTADLPWAATMQPTTSAAMNGIGHTPIGPVEGTSVVLTYLDDTMQQGLIMGTVGGIATKPVPIDFDDSGPILQTDVAGKTSHTLRTIPGPVSGNKLTFYDPNNPNRSDLTKVLTANMQVSGYGITEGTTVVSIDSGLQVTISSEVRDFGENIITFDPQAPNAAYVAQSKTVTVASAVSVKADEVKQTPVNQSIPTIPPPFYKGKDIAKASEGIKALLAACDKVGLTTKVQKCALLAIAGGESGWKPIEEDYNYNPKNLVATFSFFGKNPDDVEKYSFAAKKMTKVEFFQAAYGTTYRGKGFLGNTSDVDGGLFFGRGFIQITGRGVYTKFAKQAQAMGVDADIVADPNILIDDINKSAIISALFVKAQTPKNANPNLPLEYFYAARDAVGPYASAANKELKKKYFEYFYGLSDTNDGVIKDAGAVIATPPVVNPVDEGSPVQPGPSDASITSGSFSIGFRDPNNKYPLPSHLNEPDVNRLARGVIDGTVVKLKDAKRKVSVPKAFDGSWDQPQAPFGAQYPFNKVFESESGHV